MRTDRLKALMIVAGFLASSGLATAQQMPGFVDFAHVEAAIGREAHIEVNVRGALLRMVVEASRHEDPELAGLLSRLQGVHVRGFEMGGRNDAAVRERVAELARRMERDGWEVVARVRDQDDHVYVYLRTINDVVAGMTVMTVQPDEMIFVNIVGEIDPAQIGRIGQKFNINVLDKVQTR